MDYRKLSFSLFVLSIALFIQILSSGAEPVFSACTTYRNFTPNSAYDQNLKILLDQLYYTTPAKGYHYTSVSGKNESVYGSALCRGDVSWVDCRTCVLEATKAILQTCPYNIGAAIWYDYCSLEYSNSNHLGNPSSTVYIIRSEYDVRIPLSSLAQVQSFLYGLSNEASASKKLFVKRIATWIEGSQLLDVYGLAQCSLDLTPANCSSCIKGSINALSNYFDGKGAQVLSTTCNVRYEFYSFFRA